MSSTKRSSLATLLTAASQQNIDAIHIMQMPNGGVSKAIQSQHIRQSVAMLRELSFADDCVLNRHTEVKMQTFMDHLYRACDNFYLDIITNKKSSTMHPAHEFN